MGFAIAQVVTVLAFVWFIRDRDIRERHERAELLNRIQAPAIAIAESLPDLDPDRPLFESEADLDRPQHQEIS